jgi:predicted P-loop ATPase
MSQGKSDKDTQIQKFSNNQLLRAQLRCHLMNHCNRGVQIIEEDKFLKGKIKEEEL